jgi:hypothetical protein
MFRQKFQVVIRHVLDNETLCSGSWLHELECSPPTNGQIFTKFAFSVHHCEQGLLIQSGLSLFHDALKAVAQHFSGARYFAGRSPPT